MGKKILIDDVSYEEMEAKFKAMLEETIKPLRNDFSMFLNNRVYTVSEIAKLLGVSSRTVNRYCKDEIIKASMIGNSYRITHKHLQEFLNKQK